MNKSKIEWCDFTSNPIRGKCLHGCWYCYAERIRQRFNEPEEVCFHDSELGAIRRRKKPATIFIGSTHDIFGDWVTDAWIEAILSICKQKHEHTFLFLTKNPKRYLHFQFPGNCWCGATVTEPADYFYYGPQTFVSIEPLMADIGPVHIGIEQIIIGAMTGPNAVKPKREWVENIIDLNPGKPIFVKDNLLKLFPDLSRRELAWPIGDRK